MSEPAAQELQRHLWGPGPANLTPGLPRHLEPGDIPRWVRADDTACRLIQVPQDGQRAACLLVPSGDAARWVDRILGGDGLIGQVQGLSEAEHGVLAYAVGRALHELLPSFQLTEVDGARTLDLDEHFAGGVIWPLSLSTPLGLVDLRILLSDGLAREHPLDSELRLLLRDYLAEPTSLSQLETGDLLLSDCSPLTVTTTGLIGQVEVQVQGCHERGRARLIGQTIQWSESTARPPQPNELALVFARQRLSLAQLSRLVRGVPLSLAEVPIDPVYIEKEGRAIAEGSLIVEHGELGVRITRVL